MELVLLCGGSYRFHVMSTILSCPVLSYPILSYPILSYPLQSSPPSFLSYHLYSCLTISQYNRFLPPPISLNRIVPYIFKLSKSRKFIKIITDSYFASNPSLPPPSTISTPFIQGFRGLSPPEREHFEL